MTGRVLRTPRLRLEPIPLPVAAALVEGRDAGLLAGVGWPHADSLDGLRMDLALGDPERTGWFVVLRETGEVIGECGWRGGPDPAGEAEIGYGLAAPYRGRGLGAEAVGALVDWCLAQPGVDRLTARVLPGNVASRRVLERLDFLEAGSEDGQVRYVRNNVTPPSAN
jgi:ribosomal-protein-alanine N-acetyltransferase